MILIPQGESRKLNNHCSPKGKRRFLGFGPARLNHYLEIQRSTSGFRKSLENTRSLPSHSIDGQVVSLLANGERVTELEMAHDVEADGIGLYRTEFLYLRRLSIDLKHFSKFFQRVLTMLNGFQTYLHDS